MITSLALQIPAGPAPAWCIPSDLAAGAHGPWLVPVRASSPSGIAPPLPRVPCDFQELSLSTGHCSCRSFLSCRKMCGNRITEGPAMSPCCYTRPTCRDCRCARCPLNALGLGLRALLYIPGGLEKLSSGYRLCRLTKF